MKPKRDVTPYMASSDSNVNASLSLLKIYKRIRLIDPTYKPASLYSIRHQCRRESTHPKLHLVK